MAKKELKDRYGHKIGEIRDEGGQASHLRSIRT